MKFWTWSLEFLGCSGFSVEFLSFKLNHGFFIILGCMCLSFTWLGHMGLDVDDGRLNLGYGLDLEKFWRGLAREKSKEENQSFGVL